MKNKRGTMNVMYSLTIFVVLNVIFLGMLTFSVMRAGSSSLAFEETYSKEMSLLIDKAKPGTHIKADISELIVIAKDNGVEPIMRLDCLNNEVIVKVTSSGGYASQYFSAPDSCDFTLDIKKRTFTVVV